MDHHSDSHSVLLLWERLERKRLRQWLRLQQRLRRLLLTGHDIEDAINKNIPWVPHGAQGYYYAHLGWWRDWVYSNMIPSLL